MGFWDEFQKVVATTAQLHTETHQWEAIAAAEPPWSTVPDPTTSLDRSGPDPRWLRGLEERIARNELATRALFTLLHTRLGVSIEEFELMVQRLDLADGREDGQIGADQTREVPPCLSCARPVNPKRALCLFCGADTRAAVEAHTEAHKPKPPPPRTATCKRCRAKVSEASTYFTASGVVCTPCYSGKNKQDGQLSVSSVGGDLSLAADTGGLSEI